MYNNYTLPVIIHNCTLWEQSSYKSLEHNVYRYVHITIDFSVIIKYWVNVTQLMYWVYMMCTGCVWRTQDVFMYCCYCRSLLPEPAAAGLVRCICDANFYQVAFWAATWTEGIHTCACNNITCLLSYILGHCFVSCGFGETFTWVKSKHAPTWSVFLVITCMCKQCTWTCISTWVRG